MSEEDQFAKIQLNSLFPLNMAGEYIQADTLDSYWKQLKAYYQANSPYYQEITKIDYQKIERSEREDSDNHLNQKRLGDDTQVVDIAFYKYLPDSKAAYRVHIISQQAEQAEHYFIINTF